MAMTGESSGMNVTVSASGDPLNKTGATSFNVGPAGGHGGALGALAALADASSRRSSLPVSAGEDENQKPAIISGGTNSPSFPAADEMPPPAPRTRKTATLLEPMHPSTSAPLQNAPRFTFLSESETHGFHSQPPMGRIRVGTGGGRLGRLRSASNPEGMEKWDSYRRNDRLHFVLPSSIIEEELAEVSDKLRSIRSSSSSTSRNDGAEPIGGSTTAPIAIQAHPQQPSTMKCASDEASRESQLRRSKRAPKPKVFGTSPSSVTEHLVEEGGPLAAAVTKSSAKKNNRPRSNSKTKSVVKASNRASTGGKKKRMMAVNLARAGIVPKSEDSPNEDEEEVDESKLEPEELLRRARARLLEDMGTSIADSQSDRPGDEIALPHSLAKYKEMYNKNGRIGIYTPSERAAIIQKFNEKRRRRVWNKKIRYNCRKSLADKRMRVKGRFVKRAEQTEQTVAAAPAAAPSSSAAAAGGTTGSDVSPDEDMPDVNDAEAGFEPTEDMPYKRPRRYTIT
mmetsp:Transcript_1905/g.4604  ORF Transcript_1905/g.4604 Transcript_1905/m.4604 type:complete len:510 (+) Transcript_1905:184-1713(+)